MVFTGERYYTRENFSWYEIFLWDLRFIWRDDTTIELEVRLNIIHEYLSKKRYLSFREDSMIQFWLSMRDFSGRWYIWSRILLHQIIVFEPRFSLALITKKNLLRGGRKKEERKFSWEIADTMTDGNEFPSN